MQHDFHGLNSSCRVVRYNFVYEAPKSRTPLTIASHRREIPAWKQVS